VLPVVILVVAAGAFLGLNLINHRSAATSSQESGQPAATRSHEPSQSEESSSHEPNPDETSSQEPDPNESSSHEPNPDESSSQEPDQSGESSAQQSAEDKGSVRDQAAAYCPSSATPKLYATTAKSIIVICDSHDGLVYHGEDKKKGNGINLPAATAGDGYQAINKGTVDTHYKITSDHLKAWTKNKILYDNPITEWQEIG
jgi:cytoskeletal protein RodZ